MELSFVSLALFVSSSLLAPFPLPLKKIWREVKKCKRTAYAEKPPPAGTAGCAARAWPNAEANGDGEPNVGLAPNAGAPPNVVVPPTKNTEVKKIWNFEHL